MGVSKENVFATSLVVSSEQRNSRRSCAWVIEIRRPAGRPRRFTHGPAGQYSPVGSLVASPIHRRFCASEPYQANGKKLIIKQDSSYIRDGPHLVEACLDQLLLFFGHRVRPLEENLRTFEQIACRFVPQPLRNRVRSRRHESEPFRARFLADGGPVPTHFRNALQLKEPTQGFNPVF
jgi:hypothetical protein